MEVSPRVLVIDIRGTGVKILASGQDEAAFRVQRGR